MKRFAEFLRESRIDEELDKAPKEIYSIDLAKGRLIFEGMEDGSAPEFEVPDGADPFEAIADAAWEEAFGESISEEEGDGKKETGGVKPGWGGEEYVSLDFPSLVSERKEKEDSATLQDLLKSKEDADALGDDPSKDNVDWSELARKKLEKYSVVDGHLAFKNPETGKMEPVTSEKAEEVVKQKTRENAYSAGTKIYRFDPNGTVLVGKVPKINPEDPEPIQFIPIPSRYRANFLKHLNDKVDSEGVHFRWIGDTGALEVNTKEWYDKNNREETDDPTDKDRFDRAEYAPVVDPYDPEWTEQKVNKVLSVVNASAERKKTGRKWENPYAELGYRDGKFYLNKKALEDGKPMDEVQLMDLAISLNGGFGRPTKLLNPKAWGKGNEIAPYWNSYKISIAGSKIGKAVNFNLPPVATCAKGVPCAREGCYAIKAYAAYPAAKAAMECNLALLKKDSGFELFKESMIKALTIETKAKTRTKRGHKFTMCRFHVNGDLGVRGNSVSAGIAYLKAICEIAKVCDDVKFWMYTKQYGILSEYKESIPSNLCIIVSCWGEFNPFQVSKKQFESGKMESGLEDVEDREEDALAEAENIVRKLMGTDFRDYIPVSEAHGHKIPEISPELAKKMVNELISASDFDKLINLAWEWNKTKEEASKNIGKIFDKAARNLKGELAFKMNDPRLKILKERIPAIVDEWKAPELVNPEKFAVPDNFGSLADEFPLAYLNDGSRIGNAINRQIQRMVGLEGTEPKTCPCTDYSEIVTRCETCGLCWDGSLKGTNLVFNKH